MRRSRATLLTSILLTALACGGLDTFTITEESTATIQGSILGQLVSDLGFGGFLSMDLSQNETLANQGVSREQIDSVFVRSLTLTITAPPSGQDFTFLDSLEFYVEAPGEPRRLIASGGPFQAGLTTVGLDLENVDLAPYAAAESMSITTEASGRPPAQDTTIQAQIELEVDVNVDGALCGS